MKIQYNPKLKNLSAKLRKESTLAEVLLWNEIKGKKMLGYDFHRQRPIGHYIVDFFCNKLKLVIEVDGVTHNYKLEEDKKRHVKLESMTLKVLRYQDSEVRNNLEGVLISIKEWIRENEDSS
ncbi:MAG: endonuclease domain-containing protein [Candidatus Marinimicrobia bacterium]|nr:endonuclease domain-containing protein [Candidatus Neomarinimicrobiota bacterium]